MMKGKRIWIVDDDEMQLFLMKTILSKSVNVLSTSYFKNGQEALEELLKVAYSPDHLPDIIFLDLQMPVMNGWEFLDAVEKKWVQHLDGIELYVVSSSVAEIDRTSAGSHHWVSGFINKPFEIDDLMAICEAA
jgi:CheY-like chemotaxis protein